MHQNVEHYKENKNFPIELSLKSYELIVNLPLQMCLYLNAYFMPCWLISQLCSLNQKIESLSEIYKFLTISSLSILIVVEIPRLYLGYTGNLLEKIRELLAFWLLSVLIQLPIHLFRQLDSGLLIMPFERVIDLILFTFLVIQIIIGFVAIKQITNIQIYRHNKNN